MIPSTYVFLSMYSLINLNVINWGTREAVAKAIGKPVEKSSGIEQWLRRIGIGDENSLICRIFPCFRPSVPTPDPTVRVLERKIERTEHMLKALQKEQGRSQASNTATMLKVVEERQDKKTITAIPTRTIDIGSSKTDPLDNANALMQTRRGLWMDCEYLQCCDRGQLKQSEERFWDQLIDKYLRVGFYY